MKVRVLYKPDKSVMVIHPVPKSKRYDETEEQWLDRVFTKAMGNMQLPYDDIDASELPSRDDRSAWEGEKGKKVKVNNEKVQNNKFAKEREQKIKIEMRAMAEKNLRDKGEID